MKYAAIAAALLAASTLVYAAQVNPTSNVLADTAATANTIVLRDSNGSLTPADSDITTAKIAAQAVITAKILLDLPSQSILCVTTKKTLGTCTTVSASAAVCNCSA